jgi:hypothetical protein
MTTALQVAANSRNATHSTGPKSPEGKARSSKNALRHGLRSDVPVLPGERAEDWEEHRDGILRSLAPAGALEQALAERVALCLWRLRRAAAYETAVTRVGLEEVEDEAHARDGSPRAPDPDAARLEKAQEELRKKREVVELWEGTCRLLQRLRQLPDAEHVDGGDASGAFTDLVNALPEDADAPDAEDEAFPVGLGVPRDQFEDVYEWAGWTAGTVRRGLEQIAREGRCAPDRLLARATEFRRETQEENRKQARELERQVKELRRRLRAREERLHQRRLLPGEQTLGMLSRYEAHLSRQMYQALHELQRLQAARAGEPVPPPAALDVTVDADTSPPALTDPETAALTLEGTCRP